MCECFLFVVAVELSTIMEAKKIQIGDRVLLQSLRQGLVVDLVDDNKIKLELEDGIAMNVKRTAVLCRHHPKWISLYTYRAWLGVYMQPVCTLNKRAHATRVYLSLSLRLGFVILCTFYSLSTFTRVGFVFLLLLST